MKPRGPLNSKVLKSRFPNVYGEFFSKCQLVVSASHFLTWAGEYVGYWGGLTLLQKIPLRTYIGLEIIPGLKEKNIITIENDAKSYSLQKDRFLQDRYEHLAQQRLLEFVNSHFKFPLERAGKNIKFHILSELPLGSSGSSGALSSALAGILTLENDIIMSKNIEEWKNYSSMDLIKKDGLKFNSVFRLAWKISNVYQGGHTSGGTLFSILLPGHSPIFYCINEKENFKFPLEVGMDFDIFDKIPVYGGRIEELFHLKKISSLPIDFALVSLGEPRGTSSFSTLELREAFDKANKFGSKNLKEFFNLKKDINFLFRRKNNIWQAVLQVMNGLNLQILMMLGELFKQGAREDVLRSFLRTIDKHQILFMLLGVDSPQLETVNSIIHQEAFRIDELGAGIKSASTTKKGIILFALPYGRGQQIIDKIILRVEKETDSDLQIIYASWLDGIEEEGMKIEQDLKNGVYSEFISKNTVKILDFSQKKPNYLFLTPEEFNQQKKKIDLLLVEGEGKIYVKGKPLTSRELHSKKATIELLKILLQQKGKEIFNNELPVSSYAKDRYELQSKIVIPLLRAIEKRTKKKLDLKVKGGIINFSLQLNPGQVKIWLVS